MKKVWIVKYWQTDGVYTTYGKVNVDGNSVHVPQGGNWMETFYKGTWADSEEKARSLVEQKKQTKIASLRKSLAAVEAYEFKITEGALT